MSNRIEVYDKESGAILFKRDKDGKALDAAIKKIEELEKRVTELEKKSKKSTSK